ncbi:penicillin acylase family protein [Ferrovibrio sp.]|uniref:penicillin acylase family protein n=1 Tax=Ferrovibrio sp. TaxID=1917215 RepID=UPI001B5E9FF1|nr:penicillin acylase family protein [Ferrovibrio sp.]MBP7066598.1 penicillin acylase family protein [Ferrovibrio sp.]
MRWIFRLFVLLLVVLGGVGTAAYFIARSSLPQTSGTITLANSPLQQSVRIIRDRHAIPHVLAESRVDAMFGLGFAHAQDRLWQMEVNRRIPAGRLAEIFGPRALDTDKFLRSLGVRRAAERAYAHLKPETRAALDAYAAGVNAFLKQRNDPLPPEFLIIGIEPEPWTPTDSLGWIKMMAWDLSGNWGTELARLGLSRRLNKQQIEEFFPPYPGDAPVALADYSDLYRKVTQALDLPALARLLPEERPEGIGSNNWVLSGTHTVTGAPLLANDPHLGLSTPALWYFAHFSSPSGDAIGATLPGVPGVVLGHNGRIAWGFTNTGPDTQDLYIEKVDPADPGRYLVPASIDPSGSLPFATRSETIKVKGEPDVVLTVRETRHGPVISDVNTTAQGLLEPGYALSFAWTALRDDDRSADSLTGLDSAADWPSFVENFRGYVTPQQNIVYADLAGNIGFFAPGLVPKRKPENDLKGLAPAPGWDARYDWAGFIPFEELPRSYNPASGQVVTANHKIVPDSYPHFITSEWADPYRAIRIEQLLRERQVHSVESFKQIQGDTVSLMAAEILPLMLSAPLKATPQNAELPALHAALAGWNGAMTSNHAEPLVFQAWYRELTRLVLGDELGDDFQRLWRHRPALMRNILANKDGQARWCGSLAAPGSPAECAALVAEALDLALTDLKARYGRDPSRWRWGDAHFAKSTHRPFSSTPLRRLFEASVPTPGDTFTVNVGRNNMADEAEPFANVHAASLRAIYDLADLNRSVFIHSTGQSGHPLSAFYRSMAPAWANVGYLPMSIRPGDIEAGALGSLVLRPAPVPASNNPVGSGAVGQSQ